MVASSLFPATSWAAYPGENGLIVYAATASDGNTELFTISPSGGDPTQLTDDSASETDPSWSADGQRIVYSRGARQHGVITDEIWTMRADGTHQRRVTSFNGNAFHPSFSPGGGRIAAQVVRDGTSRIVTVRIDGTDRIHIPGAGFPRYTPNGRIIFDGTFGRSGRWGIWEVRPNGSDPRLVVNEDHELGVDADYVLQDLGPDKP